MRIVVAAICLGIIGISTANLFFSPPIASDETPSVTIVDRDAIDEVFVAGENVIYKLSANLSQLMNVIVSKDSSERVRSLSVSSGGQYIMACLTTGLCIGYDVINLTRTVSSVPLNEPSDGIVFPGNAPVVMFPGAAEGIVYTGTAIDGGSPSVYRMSLGRYRITEGSIMADTTRDYELIRGSSVNFRSKRIFKAGFSVDNFTYYIVEDDELDIRILRVCNESTRDKFQALYEIHLICGQLALFAGASILENTTSNTLVLTVQHPGSRIGRVCTYSMSDINNAMDVNLTGCTREREAVWDDFPSSFEAICDIATMCNLIMDQGFDLEAINGNNLSSPSVITDNQFGQFTSSVILQVEGELLIFIATRNGVLLKYIFINQNISNPERYNDTKVTTTSITSLQWLLGNDYVYGLTSRQVIAIPVEDCESFRECTSCTGLGDPLCGWCSIEKKCSRRNECSNNNETRRWIQDQTMCIGTFTILPTTHPVQLINQQFNVTADQLPPPLDDESYYCVFADVGPSLLEGNLIPGVNFTDLTCNYSFNVEQFSNGYDDTAVVDFSLRSNLTNINFVTIDDGLAFFNCSTHTSCRSCLSSNNLCGWCLYDKKCTLSSHQCRASTDWINTDDNSSTECPLILRSNVADGVSDYQQPVGELRNLSLNAINLPDNDNSYYRYWCVISYNGKISRIQAEYTGPNNGLLCVPGVNDFMSVSYVNNSSVSVLWMGPNVMYYLDTEIVPVTVILYNCSALAEVCSSCLSVSNLLSLDCGWCRDSSSCVVTESCSASSTFTVNSSDICPLPQITMVTPNSGPYKGGTAVIINGTDLGVVFEDVINVTIGETPCMIDSSSYQPGVGFICKTSEFAVSPSSVSMSVHDVKISINRDGSEETASLMGAFKYAMVSISNFTPERIPKSGNIIITIFGNNFDISDPMLAQIELAEIPCNITNREVLNSTFVQCIAGSREGGATGPVEFTIDNSVTESEGDFIYTDDPQVFSLRDNQVIMSGGINIIFTGRNLDVVPTVLIIDVKSSTDMILETYIVNCTSQSDRELSCRFPAIPTDVVDDIINGTLELRYSLVAASVPGLDNLHLMSQFVIDFVDDPVINYFTEPVNYTAGSNAAIMITGMNLMAVDENEILVIVGDERCNIITHSNNEISCIPPQSGKGTLNIVVYIGAYLNYTVGSLHYFNAASDSTTQIVPIIVITIMAILIGIIIVIIIIIKFCNTKKKSVKSTSSFSSNPDINMYASPAYGTHQVFTEPGLDHLYDRIDDTFMDEAIQNTDDNNNWMLKSTNIHDETDDHDMLQNDDKESESSAEYVIKDLGVSDYLDLKCEKNNVPASIGANPTT